VDGEERLSILMCKAENSQTLAHTSWMCRAAMQVEALCVLEQAAQHFWLAIAHYQYLQRGFHAILLCTGPFLPQVLDLEGLIGPFAEKPQPCQCRSSLRTGEILL